MSKEAFKNILWIGTKNLDFRGKGERTEPYIERCNHNKGEN